MMKLHAILIGINDYPRGHRLTKCLEDVKDMEAYLEGLKPHFKDSNIKILSDKLATKANIIKEINTVFTAAEEEDVVFLYYSGHGAQERTENLFPAEHDGALECLVCYHTAEQSSGYLLADKEIRYLLSNLSTSPHLVTVFDCCHSGDSVRGIEEDAKQMKRLSGFFDARKYEEFIFSDTLKEEKLRKEGLASCIPFKNHIHIAACDSSQSAWEGRDGGVFTNYLLRLLNATNNQISYKEVTRWAKISLKSMTETLQTPTYSLQGKGKVTASSQWLNLPFKQSTQVGQLIYNEVQGWQYTRGKYMGVKEGLALTIKIKDGENIKTKVTKAEAEFSEIEDPLINGNELNTKISYIVIPETSYEEVTFYVNDLDGLAGDKDTIETLVKNNAKLTASPSEADYFVNIFNQLVYISSPNSMYQPLAEQIAFIPDDPMDKTEVKDNVATELQQQLKYVTKWHHFLTLENTGASFDKPPLTIELKIENTATWIDITDIEYDMMPLAKRNDEGFLCQEFKIRISNNTDEKLYVGALNLFSDLEIDTNLFNNNVIQLSPKQKEVEVYWKDESHNIQEAFIEDYMEVYNWSKEFWHIVFIVNNFEDFKTSLDDFKQPALDNPLIIKPQTKGIMRGGGSAKRSKNIEVKKLWGTVKTTINLKNSKYNIPSGNLVKLKNEYKTNMLIAPFLEQLYLEKDLSGFYTKSKLKPVNAEQQEKGVAMDVAVDILNESYDYLRYRLFIGAIRNKKMSAKPIVIAEGDSWFLYPLPRIKDTLDNVMEAFPVRSLAAAGAEMQEYTDGQLLSVAKNIVTDFDLQERAIFVLISGGGNDIVGEEMEGFLNKGLPENTPVEKYMNKEFDQCINSILKIYADLFDKLSELGYIKQVFVHGYDYILASNDPKILKNNYVNSHANNVGIKDLKKRQKFINHLLDSYNEKLKKLCDKNIIATYVDMRTAVGEKPKDWLDEIHPANPGFSRVGQRFIDAINLFENKNNA